MRMSSVRWLCGWVSVGLAEPSAEELGSMGMRFACEAHMFDHLILLIGGSSAHLMIAVSARCFTT